MPKTLVFLPTYNEAGNVVSLVDKIFHYSPETDVLFVDDASMDGTGEIIADLSQRDARVNLIQRTGKFGLGSAHKLGMKYAVANNYDFLITMDADYSHDPKDIPRFIDHLAENDFVIGARYVQGGQCDLTILRKFISRGANFLARWMLQIPLHETTTAFRGFSVDLLRRVNLDCIKSDGYSFFVESLFYINASTKKLAEFPIHFAVRRAGVSKIAKVEVLKGILNLLKLFTKKLIFKSEKNCLEIQKKFKRDSCFNCNSTFLSELKLLANVRVVVCLVCNHVFNDL
jgi:dolichol-phosphate mannosyltransferase